MAKERERSDQDGGKVLMVSEVLASTSEALTTAAAALTSAATALNSAANALAHTSITDDKILECEINPIEARTSDQIKNLFDDFKARRLVIVKALTTDVESFYRNCNPEEELLCLYGLSDGRWELMQPVEENPPNLPDPAIGINAARDWGDRNKWLDIVAVHSDSWLLALMFFSGYKLDKECRSGLFSMINNLPTIHEVVTEASNTTKNSNKASTLEQLFGAFKARRAGILKALTTERESFYRRCYPGKDNYLCLYGLENGTWDVKLPCPVPADLPEPTMGINFARDGNKDWIDNIALHSDVWLYRITFFLGFDHDKQSGRELFSMINNLPTILEVVTAGAKKSTNDERTSNKNRKGKQPASDQMPPPSKLDCKHKRLSRGIRFSSG